MPRTTLDVVNNAIDAISKVGEQVPWLAVEAKQVQDALKMLQRDKWEYKATLYWIEQELASTPTHYAGLQSVAHNCRSLAFNGVTNPWRRASLYESAPAYVRERFPNAFATAL